MQRRPSTPTRRAARLRSRCRTKGRPGSSDRNGSRAERRGERTTPYEISAFSAFSARDRSAREIVVVVARSREEYEMKRREFLISAAAVAAAAGSPNVWAQAPKGAKQSTLDRIAIMTLNFQSMLRVPDEPETPTRTLELFDIAEMIADKYGVHKVEFQHYHIPSTEPSYLKELRAHIEKSKSRMQQINVEFGAGMTIPTA